MTIRSEKLNRLRNEFECKASWDGMQGDARQRFCGECQREVFDFAQLTAREIQAHLEASRGRLCARLTRTGGRLAFAQPVEAFVPEPWWASRRVSPVAATLVSAWLSLGTGEAQPAEPSPPVIDSPRDEAERERAAQGEETVASDAILGEHITWEEQIDVTAEADDVTFTTEGVTIAVREPLLVVFEEAGLVIAAVVGPSVVLGREGKIAEVMTELRIESLVKGTAPGKTVSYRHSEYLGESDEESERLADPPPGTQVLAFLRPSLGAVGSRGEPAFESADYHFGVKAMGRDERAAYLERLAALARLHRQAERRGEMDPAELVEWLVGTAENPLTRGETTGEISQALEALKEVAAKEGTTAEIAAQDLKAAFERFRGEGGRVSDDPGPALLGASLSEGQRERLTTALGATEGLGEADLALFGLVRGWDEEAAITWLVRQLRTAVPKAEIEEDTYWLSDLAEELENERLSALVEAAEERAEEIEELWPEDESEETERLRQEKLAALYKELRADFAEMLAGAR